jgi:hypothetical protein
VEVASTQPSPAIRNPRTHTRTSSSSSSHTQGLSENFAPPSSRPRSKSSAQNVYTPITKSTLIFPQLTSDPLPVFQSREGFEKEKDKEEISVNFVDKNNSLTLIQKKKCKQAVNNLDTKWNKQQRENFKFWRPLLSRAL